MRLVVVGHGSIGRRHTRLLIELGHDVTVFDPAGVPPHHRTVATVAPSIEAAMTGADAALVASPTAMHATHAREALRAGLPTLVEKPLATTSGDALELQRLADEQGLALGEAMNLRFHPGPATVHHLVDAGEVGQVLRASATFGSWLPGWRPGLDYRMSYSARADLGGGILLDALHEVDYITWILGPVSRVSASLRQLSGLELAGVEDVATLDLELATGVQAIVTLDYLDREYHRGCRIVGSEATLSWGWAQEHVLHTDGRGERTVHPAPNDVDAMYRDELSHFLAAVGGGGPLATDATSARRTLKVVEAARESAVTGCVVDVEGLEPREVPRLRCVTTLDRDRLRMWRNDASTVRASFSSVPVLVAEHAAWFAAKLADPECRIWIAEQDGRAIGQVRAERTPEGHAEMHIIVAPRERGRGLATTVLRLAVAQARRELGVAAVTARIRAENGASLRAFTRAGFRVERTTAAEVKLRHSG